MKFILAAATMAVLCVAQPAQADLLTTMNKYVGMHERTHRASIKKIIGVDPVKTPWCGAMLGAVVRKNGKKPPQGFMKASSWKTYGRAVSPSQARKGDVAVARYGRHTFVVSHRKGSKLCGPGGNTSNRVKVGCYGGVVAVRR